MEKHSSGNVVNYTHLPNTLGADLFIASQSTGLRNKRVPFLGSGILA